MAGEAAGELARLRDENRRLRSENQLLKARLGDLPIRKRYTPMQRLRIMWHMAYYGIPRSRVVEHFVIARSTFYRWLHAAERGDLGERHGRIGNPRKTPAELARLIWEVFETNPHFGRHRSANVM
jgi:transposase-like protein